MIASLSYRMRLTMFKHQRPIFKNCGCDVSDPVHLCPPQAPRARYVMQLWCGTGCGVKAPVCSCKRFMFWCERCCGVRANAMRLRKEGHMDNPWHHQSSQWNSFGWELEGWNILNLVARCRNGTASRTSRWTCQEKPWLQDSQRETIEK